LPPPPLPPPPLPPGHPLPVGAAVEVQQYATELTDALAAWKHGGGGASTGKAFRGIRACGTTVKRFDRLLWHPAHISGAYDAALGRYLEVRFEDDDPEGRRSILPQFVRPRQE
jgi:hypothetical protein